MPDAARKDDMLPGEAPALLSLRRFLMRAPFAPALLGVVSVLCGGQACVVMVVVAAVVAALRLWRILLCMLLCTGIAGMHARLHLRQVARVQAAAAELELVEAEGTVIDILGRGCLLRVHDWGATLALRGEEIPYAEGDRVRVLAAPRAVEPPPIRGMFDRASWMNSRGIALEADFICGERLGVPLSRAMVRGAATSIRHALAERLMPPGTQGDPRRQVLCALVLGARELAEPDTMLPFRRGGTLHAFAVSGMHVAILAGLLWPLLRILRVRPVVARWMLLLVLGFYVLVTGFSVPAVRAYVMLATLLLGVALRRRVGMVNSWCFAALLILLVEPWQLRSAGFLLSFAIYAAICIGARFCLRDNAWFGPDAYIPPRIYTAWEERLRALDYTVRGVVVVSLVASLVSLPLTAWLFHTLTPWSFLTNIAIAPLVPVVMLSGLLVLAFSGVPFLGAAATWLALRAAGLLLAVSVWFGNLPGAYLPAEQPQPSRAAMLLGTGYGGSVCMLGNPGLVIDCGSELTAALLVEPALFHAGFHPSALLLSQPAKSRSEGAGVMLATWPRLQVLRAENIGTRPLILTGEAGRFTLYPPPAELPRRPAANGAPVVRWDRPGGDSLLYVGDASRSTWELLPPEARRVDILILGRNPKQPVDDPAVLRETGAGLVILLPSAAASLLEEKHVIPEGRLLRMGARQCLPLP